MHHTFSKLEYKEFLIMEFLKLKEQYDDDYIHVKEHFENSKYWGIKISTINNLLTILLEQFEKKGFQGQEIIDFVYNLPDSSDFCIQETDVRFIDCLYKNILSE
ncbi:hypothetical protein AB9T88_09835, partial [Flavobacterium sp. LBUM151]